nr:MAG TPA: hypothetical protein [Caudoviricetes sp.]
MSRMLYILRFFFFVKTFALFSQYFRRFVQKSQHPC